MTLADVEARLDAIRDARYDDERAHALEDDLYVAVLTAIAEGNVEGNASSLALAALSSQRIKFSRWCA